MTKLIRKTQQPSDYPSNQIHDAYSTSTTDTYSCNYINEARLEEYSTTEKIIGTWIDGKPIYRKVATGTVPKSDYYPTVATGITNLDKVISISVVLAYGNNREYFSSTRYTYYLGKGDNEITIITPDVEGDATFTICYTKTTD